MQLSTIKVMEQYARNDSSVISLSQGIPCIECDFLIKEKLQKILFSSILDKYSEPQGILELRNLISVRNSDYSESEVLVTNGAMEGIASTILSLLEPGDEVIIPTPTYPSFFKIAETASVKVVPAPLDENNGWSLDISEINKKITQRTKAVLICNPNNPTGTVYSSIELQSIANLCEKNNLYLIVDEVYRDIIFNKSSDSQALRNYKSKTIRVRSFSKSFGMTGWRVGYLLADKNIVEKILPIHDSIANCAPVISQYAALYALLFDKAILPKHLKIYADNRGVVLKTIEALSEYMSFCPPGGAYYIFPKINGLKNSEKFCLDLLKKTQLAVVPGKAFGSGGEGHIRICFGKSTEEVVKGLAKLKLYLNKYYEK